MAEVGQASWTGRRVGKACDEAAMAEGSMEPACGRGACDWLGGAWTREEGMGKPNGPWEAD